MTMTRRTGPIVPIALILIGLLGLTLTWAVAGGTGGLRCPGGTLCFGNGVQNGTGTTDTETSALPNSVDAMFIVGMVPHHEDAIEMAQLALERAEHPEIKRLAEDIIRTQTDENERMREWYRSWYGESVPEDGSLGMMGGRGMMGRRFGITGLEDADPFDKAFIEQMIPHHQMGIMMARMAGGNTNRSEIRGLADDIITGQSAEIEEMQGWYQEWYGN